MPTKKYDRPALKLEFMQSDIDEVQEFLRWKFGEKLAKSNMKNKCKWWVKEKQEMKERIMSKALTSSINKQAKQLEIPMDQLTLAKKNAVVKVIQQMMNKDLDMQDLERTIKILRTEMWLPTSYAKNENTNLEKIEWVHILITGNPVDNDKNMKNNA